MPWWCGLPDLPRGAQGALDGSGWGIQGRSERSGEHDAGCRAAATSPSAGRTLLVSERIVAIDEIAVMFVAGDRARPIPEQAPLAFATLEGKLTTLRGRRFYGVVVDAQYRACVAIRPEDYAIALPHPTWVIPGGKFARQKLTHWEQHLHLIGQTMLQMRERADFDASRYCIEYYRSRRELLLMVPVL
jgi:hypothetical protein